MLCLDCHWICPLLFALLFNIHHFFWSSWVSGVCFRASPSGGKGNTALAISSISTIYSIFSVNLPTVCSEFFKALVFGCLYKKIKLVKIILYHHLLCDLKVYAFCLMCL